MATRDRWRHLQVGNLAEISGIPATPVSTRYNYILVSNYNGTFFWCAWGVVYSLKCNVSRPTLPGLPYRPSRNYVKLENTRYFYGTLNPLIIISLDLHFFGHRAVFWTPFWTPQPLLEEA